MSQSEKHGDKSVVLEARVDIRLMASLQTYFVDAGVKPHTKSELVKLGLELAHILMVKMGKSKPYETITFHDALSILSPYGNLHKGSQNKKRLHELVAAEVHVQELMKQEGFAYPEVVTNFKDPRVLAADTCLTAHLDGRRISMAEWDALEEEDHALIRERQPHLVPAELEEGASYE